MLADVLLNKRVEGVALQGQMRRQIQRWEDFENPTGNINAGHFHLRWRWRALLQGKIYRLHQLTVAAV